MKLHMISAVACALLCASVATAQPWQERSFRARDWEFVLQPTFTFGQELSVDGGSSLKIEDDFSLGFSVNYNFSEKVSLNTRFGWNSASYLARVRADTTGTPGAPSNLPNSSFDYYGIFDTGGVTFDINYNLMARRATPFVNAGLGWRWIDTNIASGPPQTGCWWDPWWGYICTPVQQTFGTTRFAYNLGGGLRLDVNRMFFMRVGYNAQWLDLNNISNKPGHQIRADFGFRGGA